jgi:hypothetical protein
LELNDRLLAGVDPDPNLSRSSKRPQLYPAFRSGCVESVAFVGGSNAKNLANAAANLSIDSYQLAKGGWKITWDNIEKLIPDLKELMSSLPAGTPIILFCLDNSSFLAASEEGGLTPISKCIPEDDGYHVKGDLVVAPECALHHTMELLKKLVAEFSEYQLFFVTPITRYILGLCCDADDHVTNSGNPDFLSKILSDLTKLKFALRKQLSPATVLDGIELICGAGCSKDRMEQTLRSDGRIRFTLSHTFTQRWRWTWLRRWPPPVPLPLARRGKEATHLRRAPRQEHQDRHPEAARVHTSGTCLAGAGPLRSLLHSLEAVTVRLTQPAVCTHSNLGTHQEDEVSTREEVKPEDAASRLNVVVETSEEGSRISAGGGHGAAGN